MRHRLSLSLSGQAPLPFPHSFIPCVTRTCRAGSSFAAASAAGADAAEQVGVGVVVEAGWRGVAGEADTVGI